MQQTFILLHKARLLKCHNVSYQIDLKETEQFQKRRKDIKSLKFVSRSGLLSRHQQHAMSHFEEANAPQIGHCCSNDSS